MYPSANPLSSCRKNTFVLSYALLSLAGLLLAGCDVEPNQGSCETEGGSLEICASLFGDPAAGMGLVRSSAEDEMPIEALLDAQGCTRLELPQGTHEWAADALSGTCTSSYEQITISSCDEVIRVSIELDSWCMDGR